MPDASTPAAEGLRVKLAVQDLQKSFGALKATNHASLDLREGELHAVIGPNGAGKTTLIAQIGGEIQPDAGRIVLDGRDITRLPVFRRAAAGLARSFQISQLYGEFTVEDNVAMAVQSGSALRMAFWCDARHQARLRQPAREALAQVGLLARSAQRVSTLAHGEQRLLELAIALALRAPVLLLDEPMAGLGAEESLQMRDVLRGLKGRYSILLVEHDMEIVFALADRITVMVYGETVVTGTPDEIRTHPIVREAYLGEPG